ncbi:exonuclease mut-7 homolog [Melanaphis sacchari]|uniref:Putative exonuclease mut-7 n=1 Tax=Melanaphis sacchari TaxID=742174 RepID=A0A2H8TTQ0_9HEMI|nr:exonuclease mut-7 homolog [Melanaphis sacchari]
MAGYWNDNSCNAPTDGATNFRVAGSSANQSPRKVLSVAQLSFTNHSVGDISEAQNAHVSPVARYEPVQTFEPDVERVAKHIQSIWATWKQSKVLTDTLRSFFKFSPNPYASLLELINIISEDRLKGKANTMANTITEEFYQWIKCNESEYEHVLTDELKIRAFKMVLDKKISFNTINSIVKIFKCNTRLDYMEELIRESIKQKKFKEACYASMSLNIQDKFSVEDFLLPLFFMNLVCVTEEFLVTSKFQQTALVKYLDDLLVENDDCLYYLANRLHVTQSNNNFSNKNQIKTNLSRIMKKYNISNEMAPNITRQKKKGALVYLFRRYQSGATGIHAWREMALESIGNDETMMLELVKMLENFGDIQECIYFAQLFAIDPSLLSPTIQQELLFCENASAGIDRPLPTEEFNTTEYHDLSLPDKQIHIIDCASKFNEFLDKINIELFDANLDVFGLDCEWKPEFTSDKSDLATIQLATIDSIYIFHLPQLQPAESFKLHWQEFSMNIFCNINILKLGFEWKGDASMIRSSIPIDNIQLHGPGFIDIKLLWKELETKWNFQLPFQNPNEDIPYNSLSDLVKLCFGRPLNKTEQFSNWEKIPLRSNQIKYAALDAYCLLEIYNLFKTKCKACNIPFDEVCQKISNNDHPDMMKPKLKHKKHKQKVPKTNMKSKSPHTLVSSVKHFKLLVPYTLEKLAERLRKCGIDTSIIERSKINNSDYIVNLIKTKNLHFIAFGYAFSKVAEQLHPGQCYCVQNHNLDDQVQEVLNFFKIVVKKEDLNSRCLICNSESYEIVSSLVMKKIYDAVKLIQNQTAVRYRPPSIDEDYEDNDFYRDEDYSEDEGTSAPINAKYLTNNSSKPDDPHSKLISGYTDGNSMIDVKPLSIDMFNDQNRVFYICNSCGSVRWDNLQWESALGSSLGMKFK